MIFLFPRWDMLIPGRVIPPPKKKTPASIICSLRSSISEPLITGCFLRPGSISNLREVGWPNLRFVGPKKNGSFFVVEGWKLVAYQPTKKTDGIFFGGGRLGGWVEGDQNTRNPFVFVLAKKVELKKGMWTWFPAIHLLLMIQRCFIYKTRLPNCSCLSLPLQTFCFCRF